jgi:hypothetical protein
MASSPSIVLPAGVTCADCSKFFGRVIKHEDAAAVRRCYDLDPFEGVDPAALEAEARAERAAELAAERFWEDPYGRGAEAAAFDRQMEDARGVIQWEDAYAAAGLI